MINVGVIGYGRAGEAHARCYDTIPQTRIVAILDPTPTRRDAARARFPHAAVAATLDDIDVDIELALICTPPTSHEAYTEQALMRDAHVFCEKPTFLDPGNGAKLIALARQRNRIIYPGHNYVHSPLLQRLRELGAPERIGPLQRLDMRIERPTSASGSPDWNPSWRRNPAVSGGGVLVDHGPHCVYLAEWLTGMHVHMVGCTMGYSTVGVEDHVELVLDMSGKIEAHILLSWRAPHRRNTYSLTGTHGTVVLNDDTLVEDSPTGRRTWRLAETPRSRHAHDDWLPALADDVLRQVASPAMEAELARPALVVAHAITAAYASAAQGGLPYRLPGALS
ncbi:Gfo/Idh/MocA family protein [Micromonospora inaquosa]|uniref:Gfo/Idh/MocA family oxidoreductase n=1 Tax=Micromonospora inaquosa TaxID=2203716 RepID=A0A3N9WY41_9ACTN|nr:Gfo/Idh/MocA family oxidoreductase [Micromonospora inaquosa]RQX05600.1 gfo/Idh/MocA family oxidoreductase [Micromonospora inaquosa]